jgi:cytidylate kinase
MSMPFVVTIDGPAGAGKSTVAKLLAQKLGVAFLDTGAMYRALTLKALRLGTDLEDPAALESLARATVIDVLFEPGGSLRVLLDEQDVSVDIRSQEVTNKTFYIARTPGVREVLVDWQKRMGRKVSLVGDGRDLGTVVFPDAAFKFFLDADFKVRCRRRADELRLKGLPVDEAGLEKDLMERDQHDLTRKVGPLKKADDALYIDSTGMSIDEVVNFIAARIDRQ